jgi:hypothetical protein
MAEKPFIAKHGLVIREGASEGITFTDLGSANSITIKSASSGSPASALVLPNADGGTGDYLRNDGAGNLSWSLSGIGTMSDFTVNADGGGVISMVDGNQLELIGGTNIASASNPGTKTVTINWSANLGDLGDVTGGGTNGDVLTYNTGTWAAAAPGGGGSGAFTYNTTPSPDTIHMTGDTGSSGAEADANFVFGSTQLEDLASGTLGDKRMLFDRVAGAFRAGRVAGTQWDTRATASVAFGVNCEPSADYSVILGGLSNVIDQNAQYGVIVGGLTNTIDNQDKGLDYPLYTKATGIEAEAYLLGQNVQTSGFNTNSFGGHQTSVVTMHTEIKLDESVLSVYTLDGAPHDPTKWASGGDAAAGGRRLFIRPNQIGGNPGYDGTASGLFPFAAKLKLSGTIVWYGEITAHNGATWNAKAPVNVPVYNTIACTFGAEVLVHRTGTANSETVSGVTPYGNDAHHPGATVECMVINSGVPQWCSDGRYSRLLGMAPMASYDGNVTSDNTGTPSPGVVDNPHKHALGLAMWDLAFPTNDGFNRGKGAGHDYCWLNEELGVGGGAGAAVNHMFPTTDGGTNSGGDAGWYVAGTREQGYTPLGGGSDHGFVLNCSAKTEKDYYTAGHTALAYTGEDGIWLEFTIHPTFNVYSGGGGSVDVANTWPAQSTLRVELVESVGGFAGE